MLKKKKLKEDYNMGFPLDFRIRHDGGLVLYLKQINDTNILALHSSRTYIEEGREYQSKRENSRRMSKKEAIFLKENINKDILEMAINYK